MPHRVYHIQELMFGLLGLVGIAAAKLHLAAANLFVLAQVDAPILEKASTDYDYMRWLLLPLIGSTFAAGIGIAFSNSTQRHEAPGRAMSGIFVGTLSVQLIAQIDYLSHWVIHPNALVLAGFLISILMFGVSKPFVQKWLRRSESIADRAVETIEDRLPLPPRERKTDD